MANKAIFLDRDGTINEDKIGYTYQVKDLKFLPFAIEGLKKMQDSEYNFIIVTNQSGIGRGLYTLKDYFTLRKEIHKQLSDCGIKILAEFFCPHHPDKHCSCRKPETGMLEDAAENFNLNLKECWMIGDKPSDILAGKNAGCRTIHVLTGMEKNPIHYSDFVANNLLEVAKYILNYKNK